MSTDLATAKARAVAYIGISRHRTSGKIRDKLSKDGFTNDTIDEAISYLESIDYVDDRRAASHILAQYRGRKGRSRNLLSSLLVSRGIPSTIAESVLDAGDSDEQRALDLVSSYFPQGADRQSIYKRLISRGFHPNLASSISLRLAVTDDAWS